MPNPVLDPALDHVLDNAVSDLDTDAATLLARLRASGRPLVITEGGQDSAVLMDAAVYRALLEEIATLKDLRHGLEDVAAGRLTPHDDARASLLARH